MGLTATEQMDFTKLQATAALLPENGLLVPEISELIYSKEQSIFDLS